MKKTILSITILFFSFTTSATSIDFSSSSYSADVSVYVTSSSYAADVSVHITSSSYSADKSVYIKRGYCGYKDKSVYITSSSYSADEEVCVSDDVSERDVIAALIGLDL